MRSALLTLWDLLTPSAPQKHPRANQRTQADTQRAHAAVRAEAESPVLTTRKASRPRAKPLARNHAAIARYESLTRQLLAEHNIRVRKWRSSMTGVAWQVHYENGSTTRLIEAPRPRGPMSAAIFLHEVGHHAIGFYRYKPRCLEEHHAWAWALAAMQQHNIPITDAVNRRVRLSMRYAIHKAQRRGIKALPPEMLAYL